MNSVCLKCNQSDGPQWALVAFGRRPGTATVLDCSEHLLCDMSDAGIDAGDVWCREVTSQTYRGIWRWDGRIVYTTTPDSPNGPAEYDVEYLGRWRPVTDDELDALRGWRAKERTD